MSLMIVSSESALPAIVCVKSRCFGVISVSSSKSVMPMIPFIGVRISWLILARNSLFNRADSMAVSRADFTACSVPRRTVMSSAVPS